MKTIYRTLFITSILVLIVGCGGGAESSQSSTEAAATTEVKASEHGVGPISAFDLPGDIQQALADQGQTIFAAKCSACHKVGKRFIGPDVAGVTDRRTPAWIMNMILNPSEMVKEDPVAKQLLIDFNGAPMANQSLTEEEARAILEYFRTL